MEQDQLFIESEREAIEALGQRIGGKKMLAHSMWPDLDPEVALQKLLDKLNKKHKAVWSSEDSSAAKKVGGHHECHIYKWWCDDNEGYQRSQPTEPKDSDEELVKRVEAAVAVMAKCVDILDRRRAAKELKSVP